MTELQKANGIISLPLDFTSIDVESTGYDTTFDHIIELSAARYEGGVLVDSFSSLVCPPIPISSYIEELTGITNEDVASAPDIQSLLPSFSAFLRNDILIGHNIGFDINILNHSGYEITNRYINTLRISRKLNKDLEHHRLCDLAALYDVQPKQFHRALEDVITTARVFLCMRERILSSMTEEAFAKSFVPVSHHGGSTDYHKFVDSIGDVEILNDDTPIFGKTVVFTGALARMERKDALLLVAQYGGIPAASITKSTNILVVGNKEFAASVKNGKTSKMKKAESYASAGLDIMTISEDTFFEMIE